MKILLTGATSLVGRRLVGRLLASGHEVTAVGHHPRVGHELTTLGARYVRQDLREAARVMQLVSGHERVLHLEQAHGRELSVADAEIVNVKATEQLILACKLHHVPRLVHLSDISVLQGGGSRLGISPETPLPERAIDAHAAQRARAEAAVRAAAHRGLEAVILRPATVLGPQAPAWLRLLMGRGWLPAGGVVDLVAVDHVVDALVAAMSAGPQVIGHTYHITNGEPLPVSELATRLAALLHRPLRLQPCSMRLAHARLVLQEALPTLAGWWPGPDRATLDLLTGSLTLDMTSARRDLGYIPRVSLAEELELVARAWEGSPLGR